MTVRIGTTCGATIWAGFYTPYDECPEEITQDLDDCETFEEAAETYGFVLDGTKDEKPGPEDAFTICFGVKCPRCKALLEWPQLWWLAGAGDEENS